MISTRNRTKSQAPLTVSNNGLQRCSVVKAGLTCLDAGLTGKEARVEYNIKNVGPGLKRPGTRMVSLLTGCVKMNRFPNLSEPQSSG